MKAILQSVSRSFYLTLRFLPGPLREPIGLAYLLARATDTIADTAAIPAAVRLKNLKLLGEVIAGEKDFAAIADSLGDFARQQTDPAERSLLENVKQCTDHLARISEPDRADIRAVLATIVRGQTLDVERFGDPAQPVALASAADLDEYTYLVAGCVGEFWTRLGFRHLPPFARRAPNEMSTLGIEYGKGLQLINVLRDRGADLRAGRQYLPPGEKFLDWLDRAESKTRAGIVYAASLTNWRMRFATVLPALIGARTIALLRDTGENSETKIKVPRPEVRRILRAALVASIFPAGLPALWARLARRD